VSDRRPGFRLERAIAFWAILLALMVLALAACGSSSSPTSSTAITVPHAGPPGTIHVVMKNIMYNPMTIHAKVGDTVTWTNEDDAPHNVTYASGPKFASSPTFTNGNSWTLKLTKAGVVRYVCTIHPGMHGTIFVSR
jgi:plastocyanin